MRRWTKSAIPRMGASAVAIITLGDGTRAIATVILTTDRSLFPSSNPIVSAETFDEFPHPTQFPLSNQSVTTDLVTHFDAVPNPGWRLDQLQSSESGAVVQESRHLRMICQWVKYIVKIQDLTLIILIILGLKQYYEAQRQSPILGSEEFIERVRPPGAAVAREHARYERRVVQAGPEHVVGEVVRQYKVTRDEIFRGKRGRENEARKVAMYLVKRCCDRTLPEIAEHFGTGGYSAVSWSCRAIETKMANGKTLRDRIEKIAASIHQLHT